MRKQKRRLPPYNSRLDRNVCGDVARQYALEMIEARRICSGHVDHVCVYDPAQRITIAAFRVGDRVVLSVLRYEEPGIGEYPTIAHHRRSYLREARDAASNWIALLSRYNPIRPDFESGRRARVEFCLWFLRRRSKSHGCPIIIDWTGRETDVDAVAADKTVYSAYVKPLVVGAHMGRSYRIPAVVFFLSANCDLRYIAIPHAGRFGEAARKLIVESLAQKIKTDNRSTMCPFDLRWYSPGAFSTVYLFANIADSQRRYDASTAFESAAQKRFSREACEQLESDIVAMML